MLNHAPFIVEVRHVNTVFDQSEIYMRYYNCDLHHKMYKKHLDIADIRKIMHQLLQIISYAHQHGVIHGDLIP